MTQDTPAALDANALEAMARERPNDMFLKGSGVLKLTGAIRTLEREVRELRTQAAASAAGGATGDSIATCVSDLLQSAKYDAEIDDMRGCVKAVAARLAALAAQSPDSGAGPDSSMADAWEHSAADAQSQRSGVGERLYTEGLAEGMRICARDLRAALAQQGTQNGR